MQDEFLRLQSVLKKTIVFITHDFDEAIRLADRIAIMKDGRDRPDRHAGGTRAQPRPTPYVAEFTNFTFTDFTRFIAAHHDVPYRSPRSSPRGCCRARGSSARATPAAGLLDRADRLVLILGYWAGGAPGAAGRGTASASSRSSASGSAMVTLASIVVAVPLGVVVGLLLGLLAYRWPASRGRSRRCST
jgi:energy-coupling factor transporter ATP-binding protein EcfA2